MSQESFHCPGDQHPIGPSVHFARLRAGFSACKSCSQQHVKGMLELIPPANGFHQIPASAEMTPNSSPIPTERIFRTDQTEYFEALIHHITDWFWSQQAFVPQRQDFLQARIVARPQSPTLIVGFDGDLKTADRMNWAIERLNLLGVKVIDTGKIPISCLEYLKINLESDGYLALQQLNAPHHTLKIECLSKSGKSPLESPHQKKSFKQQIHNHREQRTSGNWRTHSGLSTYEASFFRRLHGLRPLKICFHFSNSYHQVLLQQLSEEWPCESTILSPHENQQHSINQQMVSHIRKENADFGCQISTDGKHVTFWDETGKMLSQPQLDELLVGYLIKEYPDDFISIHENHREIFHRLSIYQDRIKTHKHQSEVFLNPNCRLLVNERHEIWHKDPELRRDGFLTLIYIIRKLSEKDHQLSELTQLKTFH